MPAAPWSDAAGRKAWEAHLKDMRAYDRELADILKDAAGEVDRILRGGLPSDAGVGAVAERAQLKQVAYALRVNQADLFDEVSRTLKQAILRTQVIAGEGTMEIDAILGKKLKDAGLRESFLASSRHSIENVRSRLANDIKLSRQVYRTQKLSQGWVDRVINRGLAGNRSAAQIARDVATMINPNTPGGVSYAARRLARTEINNAFHTTSIRTAAAQPWVEGMKWQLSGSHPRPDPCDDFAHNDPDDLGEGVYKPTNVPGKPHPQCLCYVSTVVVDEDLFVDRLVAGRYDRFLRG